MEVACLPESTAVARLFGRGREQQRVDLLLGAARLGRSGALLLRGDLGTGKTALLDYASSRAERMQVLRCHGDRAESELRFAALHQLLQPLSALIDDLPDRVARPLADALGGRAAPGEAEGFVEGTALLALLSRAARDRPLLCLVDDAQWLDRASATAISFAARRLGRDGMVLLVAVRDGEGRPFEPAGVPVTALEGLDRPAAAQLIAARAGIDPAPEVARQLIEQTGGIPLALAEAASGLTHAQLAGLEPLPRPLPLSQRLREALLEHVRRLPAPTQRLLLLVAAAESARVDVLTEAGAELGIGPSALAEAEAANIVRIDGYDVRLRSRLVHAAVYTEAPFFQRRAAHLALAHALGEDDEDRRAWHLAAAALTRDAAVAADLERAAERAGFQGDPEVTADALQRAAHLTPDGPERARRLTAAARAYWLAGRTVQAVQLLDGAERLRPAPLLDAEIAELRGGIAFREQDLEGSREALMAGADRVADAAPERALELLIGAGRASAAAADAAAAEAVARRAAAIAGGPDETAALLETVARVLGGSIEEAGLAAGRAISMAHGAGWRVGQLLGLASGLSPGGDLPTELVTTALDLLGGRVGKLRARGTAGLLPAALASLAWLELWTDRLGPAHANATEGLALARSLGQRWPESRCAMTLAVLAAIRGDEAECAALGDLLHHPPGVQSAVLPAGTATWAAALADLGAGRFAEAQARLEDLAPGRRLGHPWHALWSRPDAVEAGVRSGRLGPARAALQVLERAVRPDWPAPAAALLARSRALLASGRDADQHYAAALALHAEVERPLQQARTRLLWAEHLRRNRRRVDAREQLRAALVAFERLGALPWAERARAELRATGETVQRADPGRERLTPQERRIAELVADGGSNREVAERLFLSPRTVGYHLERVYRKLGVSSRTRLARLLRDDEVAPATGGQRQPGLSGRARTAFRSRAAAAPAPEREVGDLVPLPVTDGDGSDPDRLDSAGPRAS